MNYTTEISLFSELQTKDGLEKSWCYFYEKYAPLITRFAARKGIPQSETCDILQETMLELYSALPRFKYDRSRGKFRNFVLLITHRKCSRYFAKRQKTPNCADPKEIEDQIGSQVFENSRSAHEPVFDSELQLGMVSEALESLRKKKRISTSSHKAYKKYAIECKRAEAVARELQMSMGQIYRIKNRINKMIQEEIRFSDSLDSEMLDSIQF